MFEGCNQENEKEVLLLGGGHEPQGGQESQEAPCEHPLYQEPPEAP